MFEVLDKASKNGSVVFSGPQKRELEFGLTPEQIQLYREKGFIVIKNILSQKEIQMYRESLDQVIDDSWSMCESMGLDPKNNLRYEIANSQGKDVIWKIDPFYGLSAKLSSITRHRRIIDAVASLMDGYDPVLFKDKMIIKPPQSHGNSLHQDYNWWQGFPTSLLSVSIALDDTNKTNGCTEMYTGNKRGFLHEKPGTWSELKEETLANEEHHHIELNAGDMAIFHCHTPHRAATNNSTSNRRVFFLSYGDSRDGDHYQEHYKHMRWYRTDRLTEEQQAKMYYL